MKNIQSLQKELTLHPVYQTLNSLDGIRHFMEYHVFAVWDFMSLLKALQVRITSVSVPWRPSSYPTEMVRLVNQIVLGEESDVDPEGRAVSHFELYLEGMEEVGADTTPIRKFIQTQDFESIPEGVREFVKFNTHMAQHSHVVEVAANFFFGREKLIPDMFASIVETLKKEKANAPTFLYYLERHIEVDAHEHGPLAMKALDYLTGGDSQLRALAEASGTRALEMRKTLWDKVLEASPVRLQDHLNAQSQGPHSLAPGLL